MRHVAFTGELPIQIAEHDIISLRRIEVLAWAEQTPVVSPVPCPICYGTDVCPAGTKGGVGPISSRLGGYPVISRVA